MSERDCKHGQLARSCEICELEAERDALAAEVARVQRLEAESEAARAFRNEYRKDFGAWKDLRDDLFQLLDEHDEAAALAEIDAGEGDDE